MPNAQFIPVVGNTGLPMLVNLNNVINVEEVTSGACKSKIRLQESSEIGTYYLRSSLADIKDSMRSFDDSIGRPSILANR